MTDTGAIARWAVRNEKSTLRRDIYAACKSPKTCYELEIELGRTHQSVSGTIRYMVKAEALEIQPYTRLNQFGNQVRVYKAI